MEREYTKLWVKGGGTMVVKMSFVYWVEGAMKVRMNFGFWAVVDRLF